MIRLLPSLRRTDLGTLLGSIVGVLHKAKLGGGYALQNIWDKLPLEIRGRTVRFPKPHALDPEPKTLNPKS